MNEQSEFMVEKLTSVSLDNSDHTNMCVLLSSG
jgi:hypothetical protein